MNGSAVRESGRAWAHLLAVAAIVAAMALAGAVACGGDDDGDSRPTSRPSEERESAGDGDEDDREAERESSRQTDVRLILQESAAVPNLDYVRVVLVDVGALLSGEVPREIATVPGIRKTWLALTAALGSSEENPLEMSMGDLETFIFMEGYFGAAFAIQGDYSEEAIRNSLVAFGGSERLDDVDFQFEAWHVTDLRSYNTHTVVFAVDHVFGVNRDFENSSEFLDPFNQDDWLQEHLDNPIVRAFNRLGRGWLVFGQTEPWHRLNLESPYLATAFAASSTGSESSVEVTWVVLFENSEDAEAAKTEIEATLTLPQGLSDVVNPEWITYVGTDGDFVVLEVSLPVEEAAEYFDELIDELQHPDP